MHIVLAILGSVITILFYLNRLSQSGIDFGWLNPFAWRRRRDWSKLHGGDPIYKITSPMEATAMTMYAMAKGSGDISREQKHLMIDLFEQEFNLSHRNASELLSSCSFIMQNDEDKIINNFNKFLSPSMGGFSPDQMESAYELVLKIYECEGRATDKQKDFLSQVENAFIPSSRASDKWA